MVKRSDKLKRLVAVQRHLEQMAEMDLALSTQQRQEVAETMDAVAAAIVSLNPVHRNFSNIYAAQIGKLRQKDVMLAGVQQMHEMRIVRERTKADRLAEQMLDARNLEDREEADNAVYDLIDQHIAYGKDRDR
jgi:translation initiation factor IF-2